MWKVDEQIQISDEAICKLIDTFGKEERGFLSQGILDKLRSLVEAVSVKATGEIEYSYDIYQKKAKNYVASVNDLRFLSKFHKLLNTSKSHYATDESASERLMLKYYEYLLRIKSLLKSKYGMDVLSNIYKFPLDTDETLREYHRKISIKIDKHQRTKGALLYKDRFYILKIKPFFVNQEVYYEVTFRIADDKTRKYDRLIAFTKIDMSDYYAMKLAINFDHIDFSSKRMPIQIIIDWDVSIRPCEIRNFEKIFDSGANEFNQTKEYNTLMSFLKNTGLNLVEIVTFPENYYTKFKERISAQSNTKRLLDLLDKSRSYIKNQLPGSNVLRYLLYSLNNRVLKEQYTNESNYKLSGLNLLYKCIPFDEMPFATFPAKHTPNISSLFFCLDASNREHELLARRIQINAEVKGCLYTPKKELETFENIDLLMDKFNRALYQGTEAQRERKLEMFRDHIYITGYENAVVEIINKLASLSDAGIKNYSNAISSWLASDDSDVDCDQKQAILKGMFKISKVSILYGAAGTGKTKLIEHISKFHNERNKLYLTNTHSAISNLRSRITAQKTDFRTIKSFLFSNSVITDIDILIIDECSVVSNLDMRNILRKANFGALILVGDIFQIEAIRFGNWFYIVKSFLPESAVTELTTPWRAKDNNDLLKLWDKVRNLEIDIDEHLVANNYSAVLDESIFDHSLNDEIILCLNYDGFYGINNINKFLQESNINEAITWGVHTYKVYDPILFNDSKRFSSIIHNNLKGIIVAIEVMGSSIQFDVQIDRIISELDIWEYDDLELLDCPYDGKSIIRFSVNELRSTDEDDDLFSTDIVPFQVAYAVSIHKAQGLEYDSVKIVITNETEEMITHNIFYTAITRAKKRLKIFWSPEAQHRILNNMEMKFNNKDAQLIKDKYSI